jgi:hypothetical protein
MGNVCIEYAVDDARKQSSIRYAIFEKDSKSVNYDLDQEELEDRCCMAGVDLTDVAEKELEDRNPFPSSAFVCDLRHRTSLALL